MKTIVNKSQKPIRIPLPGGRAMHLGPAKSGQISDHNAASPAVRKLVDAGVITLTGGEGPAEATAEGAEHVHEGTHGHAPRKVVRPRGDR